MSAATESLSADLLGEGLGSRDRADAPGEDPGESSVAEESLCFRGRPNRRGRPYLHSALTLAHLRQGSPVIGDLSHRSL